MSFKFAPASAEELARRGVGEAQAPAPAAKPAPAKEAPAQEATAKPARQPSKAKS